MALLGDTVGSIQPKSLVGAVNSVTSTDASSCASPSTLSFLKTFVTECFCRKRQSEDRGVDSGGCVAMLCDGYIFRRTPLIRFCGRYWTWQSD
jgi:hypothetical protein